MEVEILHQGSVKFEAVARGHRVLCDQPAGNGGQDSGMTPPEFLLVALGTCAGYYAAQYLKARSLPTDGLRVNVSAEKASHPARLAGFRIDVTVPAVDSRHVAGVLQSVRLCLIHNTLLNTPSIDVAVHAPAEAALVS